MGILKTVIDQSDQILTAKKMVQVYLLLNNIHANDREITLLTHYCLYGASNDTDAQIAKQELGHLKLSMARQLISNIKLKLRKYKLIQYDETYRTYSVTQPLASAFQNGSQFGYMIQFKLNDDHQRHQSGGSRTVTTT